MPFYNNCIKRIQLLLERCFNYNTNYQLSLQLNFIASRRSKICLEEEVSFFQYRSHIEKLTSKKKPSSIEG